MIRIPRVSAFDTLFSKLPGFHCLKKAKLLALTFSPLYIRHIYVKFLKTTLPLAGLLNQKIPPLFFVVKFIFSLYFFFFTYITG